MKRVKKPVFFVVALLILALAYCAFFGVYASNGDLQKTVIRGAQDIRWGTDIQGGVKATFGPPEGYMAVNEDGKEDAGLMADQMKQCEAIIKVRLANNHITDYELYTDTNYNRIILSFPWASGEEKNAEATIAEISENADLMFIEGYYESINVEYDNTGARTVTDAQGNVLTVVCDGSDIAKAKPSVNQDDNSYYVYLEFNEEGTQKFAEATGRMVGKPISIWLDDVLISYPTVNEAITSGQASISGKFTFQEVTDLANKIEAGALPFKMETQGYEVIESTLGTNSLRAMAIAAIIAFAIIAVFMIFKYRLPGAVACLALLGQVAGSVAAVSGFFPNLSSFTLTIPGIAGIILSMGMGIDANIITAERIKEEVLAGKSVFGAIDSGCRGSFSAIFDGNITNVIVAIILMTIFGPPSELLSKLLGPSTVGVVYSFGYTLLIGVIFNFIM
ncbi:MAG: SecD/SecF family protein translocase subunit, partial [Clostridia bacterium]|nr:SecD/SecF family protein translocase subunit [Clostridia bacterium]